MALHRLMVALRFEGSSYATWCYDQMAQRESQARAINSGKENEEPRINKVIEEGNNFYVFQCSLALMTFDYALENSVSDTETTWEITEGDGLENLPSTPFYLLTWENKNKYEWVRVDSRSGSTLTVTRDFQDEFRQDGAAQAWDEGQLLVWNDHVVDAFSTIKSILPHTESGKVHWHICGNETNQPCVTLPGASAGEPLTGEDT